MNSTTDRAARQVTTYGIARFREHETMNGIAYAGRITKAGRMVGGFEHDGNGGGMRYWLDDRAEQDAFETEVARVIHEDFEPAEYWVLAVLDGSLVSLAQMLTVAEAAARLGLSPHTVRNQVRAGRIRAKRFGPVLGITEGEVERYRAASLGRVGRPPKP